MVLQQNLNIFYSQNVEHQLPQSFTYGSFVPQSFAPSHSSLGDNRIKEEPSMTFSGFQRCSASGNGIPSSTVPIGDILFYYPEILWFESSYKNGLYLCKVWILRQCCFKLSDDIFVYGGPHPHRIFPPPMPSSVNDTKVENDVEQRLFGSDERAVYEEALKV